MTDTPETVRDLFHRVRELTAESNRVGRRGEDEECDRLVDEAASFQWKMVSTRSASVLDLRGKVQLLFENVLDAPHTIDPFLVLSILIDLDQLQLGDRCSKG